MHETRSQLHRAKLQNKPTRPLSQKDWGCVSVCCLCTVPQLRTVSPFVTVLWNLQMQALLATRGRQSRRVSWVAVIQPVTRHEHKLLSRRHWPPGAKQRESSKMEPSSLGLWKVFQQSHRSVLNYMLAPSS